MPAVNAKLETFVSPDELKAVILNFEGYPSFMKEVSKVEVHSRSDSEIEATFHVDVSFAGFELKSYYRLRYEIDGSQIRWSLVESPDITVNRGSWRLEETDDGETIGHYEGELETSLPIPPEVQAAFAEQELPKLMEKIRDKAEE